MKVLESAEKVEIAIRSAQIAKTFLEMLGTHTAEMAHLVLVDGITQIKALDEFIKKVQK